MRHSFVDSAVWGRSAGPVTQALYIALTMSAAHAAQSFRLQGIIQPEAQASVTIYGATRPFTNSTLSDESGRFTVKNLEPGAYTVSVYVPGSGEARKTVEVGAGTADRRGTVRVVLRLPDEAFEREALRRSHAVGAKQLSVPETAQREYAAAQRDLAKRDIPSAIRRLEHAVDIAPQFALAWNNLGTIAYQTQNFARAEECFREGLRQDPALYEPLVNLGGVLINLRKLDEALELNVHAVLVRPGDALANSQLGMTYFEIGNFDSAIKYLERARKIDPAHFSHPQIYLAEIHLRRGENREAAEAMEDFVTYHPDYPQAEAMRAKIAELRR